MRILVLGGYGNFGARIGRSLASDAALDVIAGGRRPCSGPSCALPPAVRALAIDATRSDLADRLREIAPAVVVNCVGPYQGQGYGIAEAALRVGAHYVDLADGRDFVAGFAESMAARARAAGRLAITGASTLPALSSAVVDALKDRLSRIDVIDTIIAPAQRAPRGAATLAGVMSYAGRPFSCLVDGQWVTRAGWMALQTVDLGPLGTRLSAECDVPDLAVFPQRYPGVATVRFRAALESPFQHRGIAALAAIRRAGIPVRVERLAGLLERAAGWFDAFGSETGGMRITLEGRAFGGERMRVRWSVLAPNNHGPEIPCMAAILLVRKLARGELAGSGAHACMGFLELGEFFPEFARWGMTTTVQEERL